MRTCNFKSGMSRVLIILAVGGLSALALLACRGEAQTPASTAEVPAVTVATDRASTPASGAAPRPSEGDPLYDAIWRGEVEPVEALLAAGADVNAVDQDGNPYLLEAIWRGHTEIVRVLASAGADLNALDSENDPLLHEAVWRNNPDMVHTLVELGADVNARDSENDPLLHEAIWRDHREVAKILVTAGADVNTTDSDGDPLLYTVVWRDKPEALRILVEAGAGRQCEESQRRIVAARFALAGARRNRGDTFGCGGH